jgi:hypothetical protein
MGNYLDSLINAKETGKLVEEANDAVYSLLSLIGAKCYLQGVKEGFGLRKELDGVD